MNVAVVGLGKIGLPLAVQYASRGLDVTGYDIDTERVDAVNSACCPISGEEGLEAGLQAAVAAGQLRATTNAREAIAAANVVVLIVPVGLTAQREPDYRQLDAATSAIAPHLSSNALVVVETTVPVGTTRNRVGGALGRETLLAASPERVSSGRILRDLQTYPKIVGPLDEESWQSAGAFYNAALEAPGLIRVRNPETAEFAKIAEGVYRDVNIALAGDLARLADAAGVDAVEAFAAANTQPYSHLHEAGVGVGGHCLPVYPYFLPDEEAATIPRNARTANDDMAAYGVTKLEAAVGPLRGRTVLILGLAYRANVKEPSHSSTFLLQRALEERGARVLVHDPLFSDDEIRSYQLEPSGALPVPAEAIVVQAWHDAYRELDWRSFPGCQGVLDGRNALIRREVEAAGLAYIAIGRPSS